MIKALIFVFNLGAYQSNGIPMPHFRIENFKTWKACWEFKKQSEAVGSYVAKWPWEPQGNYRIEVHCVQGEK